MDKIPRELKEVPELACVHATVARSGAETLIGQREKRASVAATRLSEPQSEVHSVVYMGTQMFNGVTAELRLCQMDHSDAAFRACVRACVHSATVRIDDKILRGFTLFLHPRSEVIGQITASVLLSSYLERQP